MCFRCVGVIGVIGIMFRGNDNNEDNNRCKAEPTANALSEVPRRQSGTMLRCAEQPRRQKPVGLDCYLRIRRGRMEPNSIPLGAGSGLDRIQKVANIY